MNDLNTLVGKSIILKVDNKEIADQEGKILLAEQPTIVTEGKASVSFSSLLDVFYNPVQEFNRDLSTAVIRLCASDYQKIINHKSSVCNTGKGCTELKSARLLKPADFDIVDTNCDILPVGAKCQDGIRILEALAASGLRSIRYAKEIGGVRQIIANDNSQAAVSCMERNILLNGVQQMVTPSLSDANLVMYEHRDVEKRFQVVDIDPYGSPHTFLETAVQCVNDGGILLVTATDMAVLCGRSPEACYAKYGAVSMPISACHEMGLRILLQTIEHHANKYGRYIQPLLSLSVDFYCRVIVRVFTSKKKVKESFTKVGLMYSCVGCESIELQPLGSIEVSGKSVRHLPVALSVSVTCEHCGHRKKTAGPMWLDALHDKQFVKRLNESVVEADFGTARRMKGTLSMVEEELNVPFYLLMDKVYQICKIGAQKMKTVMSPLLNAGYHVSLTHAKPNALKTDAPMAVMWDILRELSVKECKPARTWPPDHPSSKILGKKTVTKVDLTRHPQADTIMADKGYLKFQVNPQKFWGPRCKSTTSVLSGDMQERSKRKQGKRQYSKNTHSPQHKKTKT